MIKNIQEVLAPLLIVSYVCGLRIIVFPTDFPKLLFSLLYTLFFWSVYILLMISIGIPNLLIPLLSEYYICLFLNNFITLLTVVFGVYYNKKFRKCIERIAIVDDTLELEQLGITRNNQKLRKRTLWIILGWFTLIILINYLKALHIGHQYDIKTKSIYLPILLNYCIYVNFVEDLIVISILRYIGLKFDQINENFQKLMRNNKHEVTKVSKIHVLQSRQCRLFGTLSNNYIIWIVIHIHLELCKTCREINSIFGLQMTLKMGLYFGFIASGLHEIFDTIFIKNHVQVQGEFLALLFLWITIHIFKLFFINYICERVSNKANITGKVINNVSYSISDVEIRENIIQFLLQLTQSPLRFYGLGLFQFGNKFLQGFFTSIATVLVILIQVQINKQIV